MADEKKKPIVKAASPEGEKLSDDFYDEYPDFDKEDDEKEPGEWDVELETPYIEDEKVEYDYKPLPEPEKPKPRVEFKQKKKQYEL
ncbi:MAG: hypothetical protein JW716_05255 [Candidatus Aenigmarchaeota archaeon]|nr:hypothetical protein [Candidatus Aenigmarchaeota archaeon]